MGLLTEILCDQLPSVIQRALAVFVERADDQLRPVNKYYLGDQEAAMRKAAAVANQGKAR